MTDELSPSARRRERDRERRRAARIRAAADRLGGGLDDIEIFVAVARADGATNEDHHYALAAIAKRLRAAADQLDLLNVHGPSVVDDELDDLAP